MLYGQGIFYWHRGCTPLQWITLVHGGHSSGTGWESRRTTASCEIGKVNVKIPIKSIPFCEFSWTNFPGFSSISKSESLDSLRTLTVDPPPNQWGSWKMHARRPPSSQGMLLIHFWARKSSSNQRANCWNMKMYLGTLFFWDSRSTCAQHMGTWSSRRASCCCRNSRLAPPTMS